MDEEEVAALRRELAAAQAENERLQALAGDAEARASALTEQAQQAEDALAGSVEAARTGAERYRRLAVRAEPDLPAELIAGDTVDAIDASIEAARATVGRVRAHLESQAQGARVPAGAPPRGGPDFSGLSAQQKIRFGLERAAR